MGDINRCNTSGTSFPPYVIAPDLQYIDANDGVCIDKIICSDGFNTDNTTTTSFTFSNGVRLFPGGYFWNPTNLSQTLSGK